MPSWKKVILSGSNAALNTLTVSNGITGSLLGTATTASYVLNAVSASFATSASRAVSASRADTASFVAAPGSTTQVVFNSLGALSASSGFVFSGSRVGIGTASPLDTFHVVGSGRFEGSLDLGHGGASEYSLEIGAGRSGNGFAYIDLVGDTTYPDYGLRIIRGNTGVNSTSTITHRGTGNLLIETNEIAPIVFNTLAIERARISSGGNFGVGTANPTYKLTVETAGAVDGIALNGSNNFVLAILESGTVRGYSPAFPTTPGAFSTDSNTRDFVYRVEAATQRFLFNTNAGAGGSTLAITGSRVGINTATPTLGNLEINGNVWANSYTGSLQGTASFAVSASSSISSSYAITASFALNGGGGISGGTTNYISKYGSATTLVTSSLYDDGTNVGIGTSSPTKPLEVNGGASFAGYVEITGAPTAYEQFRIRDPYTPSSTGDTNGDAGSITWDDNYIYVKTSVGWKRSGLSTF